MKLIVVTKAKEVSQIKPRLGQGRAELRCKIKMPVPHLNSRSVGQDTEKPIEQPEVILKVPIPETSRIYDKIVPDYAIPHISLGDHSSSKWLKEKLYRMLVGKFPYIQFPFTDPLLNQKNNLYPKFLEAYQILTQKLIGISMKIHHFKKV